MEQQLVSFDQLLDISKSISELSESEESARYLKEYMYQAHQVAKIIITHSQDPDAYYGNHLVRMLLNDAQDTDLYWVYTKAGQRTNLFNRCQRFALVDIQTLVQYLKTL
jgi:N-acetylglutamate synthase-like GNAT family acetyltransferase